MNKRIISAFAAFAVCALMAFPSCQDKSEYAESTPNGGKAQPQSRSDIGTVIYDTTKSIPVSKAIIPRKYSTVYCYNLDMTRSQYATMKIRNMAGTIVQEWLYENLNTNMFLGYHWSGDTTLSMYGTFYKWEGDLYDLTQSDWNFMMTDADENPETGFHIPTATDLSNLATIVGGSANIPQYLNLTYGSNYFPLFDNGTPLPSNNAPAVIWEDYRDPNIWPEYPGGADPNRVEGCGVFRAWPKVIDDDHRPSVCYTNIEELGCNVRLVRTISLSQW